MGADSSVCVLGVAAQASEPTQRAPALLKDARNLSDKGTEKPKTATSCNRQQSGEDTPSLCSGGRTVSPKETEPSKNSHVKRPVLSPSGSYGPRHPLQNQCADHLLREAQWGKCLMKPRNQHQCSLGISLHISAFPLMCSPTRNVYHFLAPIFQPCQGRISQR